MGNASHHTWTVRFSKRCNNFLGQPSRSLQFEVWINQQLAVPLKNHQVFLQSSYFVPYHRYITCISSYSNNTVYYDIQFKWAKIKWFEGWLFDFTFFTKLMDLSIQRRRGYSYSRLVQLGVRFQNCGPYIARYFSVRNLTFCWWLLESRFTNDGCRLKDPTLFLIAFK